MTKEERKAYMKAYKQAHKEERKAWYEAHKEQLKANNKAYYQSHKEQLKANMKAYRQAHKEEHKAYIESHKEQYKVYQKAYQKSYQKSDVNSLGQTKTSTRKKSWYILKQMNLHIPGYQTHHCFGYEDPTKFIYISKELHLKIHQFLRDNNIDADSDHYEQIKHLLDENVITFGL